MKKGANLKMEPSEQNELTTLSPQSERQLSVEQARAIQEVQGAIVSAKRFPRDMTAAYKRIIEACKRKGLAEQAMYAYKRGATLVTGPSIRMAEMLAQNYGNIGCGITELASDNDETQMQAYCIDYETNYQKRVTFSVPHVRDTKNGPKKLTDARDIYEHNFNMGARRLRACILAIIPGDFIEDAVETCEKTLAGDTSKSLSERIRSMTVVFEGIGVTQEMIEKRLGHKVDAIIEHELVTLRKIYKSIEDGISKSSEWFETGAPAEGGKATTLKDRLKNKEEKKTESKEPEPTSNPGDFENFNESDLGSLK